MDRQDVNKLLALMKANYGYAFKNMGEQEKYLLLNTWTFTLQDLDPEIVMIAVMQLISVCKWMPTVAEIREECQKLYYTAAYKSDYIVERMIAEGDLSEEDVITFQKRQKSMNYIAHATNHLRGDRPAKLQLESILDNQSFHALGEGRSNFDALSAEPSVVYTLQEGQSKEGR